ncbi:hypothetical protein AWC38_SpisGene18143 [Stylophora pistillata]|uniref:PKD/REJ-like domain-containing protein n=1 Tax=Stylophora pistillata TaxID=50429 RepID=A0A2B4RMI4_STYPI|nr:hypothetical protein AWC38_SpisGene18143 [Stylophora pistillata]
MWRKISNFQLITRTPLNSSDIVIKKGFFVGGNKYRLALFVSTTDGLWEMNAHDISIASPPTGRKCLIALSRGTSLETDINLSCSNWKSDSSPLSYQIQYRQENGLFSMLYQGVNNTMSTSWILPGNSADNFTVQFIVTVNEKFGILTSPTLLTAQVINSIIGSIESWKVKDIVELLQSSSVIGSAFHALETASPESLIKPSKQVKRNVIENLLMATDSSFNEYIKEGNLGKTAQIANAVLRSVSRENSLDLQGKILVKISMTIIEKIADSVLAVTVPDEKPISITAGQLSIMLGRYTFDRLSGLEIRAGKGRVILPPGSHLFVSGVSKTSFVDVQGKILVKISMTILEKIADSVLAMTVPDEKPISITAGQLSIMLGRYTFDRLSGLEIRAGKGRVILPPWSHLFVSGVSKTSFADVQVANIRMYWGWLQNFFLPGVFSGRGYNGQEEKNTMYIGDKHSLLVGMARVRQLRVKSNDLVFTKMANIRMYWGWLQNFFLPGVFSGRGYNGQEEKNTMYIGDKHSLLVGMARVRQLRVKSRAYFQLELALGRVKARPINELAEANKTIIVLREKITREKIDMHRCRIRRQSLFDKISSMLKFATGKSKNEYGGGKEKKEVRFQEDAEESSFRKLRGRKHDLLQRLERIVSGFSEEDEDFHDLLKTAETQNYWIERDF